MNGTKDESADFNALPIFDMQEFSSTNDLIRKQFILRLRDVCHHVGFFYIKNHGMSQDEMQQMLKLTEIFFNLEQQEKDAISITHSPHFRGYGKLRAELTEGKPDFKETLDLGFESYPRAVTEKNPYLILHGPNQWPTSKYLEEIKWREKIVEFISRLHRIGSQIIGAMSLALGFSENFLRDQFCLSSDDAFAILRLLKYPPSQSATPEMGVGPHVDSGCLILLLQDEIGGLQVQNCAGKWVDATPIPGTFVVNIGHMLQIWSNNYFLATPHRVLNTSQKTRYSVPFFLEPNLSTTVTPLDIDPMLLKNSSRELADKNTRVIYGEYMLKIYERSFPRA